jgi:hypothetical protein
VDAYKQAKLSAAKAEKYAREAELSTRRVGMELSRLQALSEPFVDKKTMRTIEDLVKSVDSVGHEQQFKPSPESSTGVYQV